jgi:hypothetical protein
LIIATGALVVLVSLAGLPYITVDGSLLRNFPASNAVKVADAEFVRHFEGSAPMQVVLDGGRDGAWKEPSNLRAVAAFQEFIEGGRHCGETRSIVDYVKRMNAVMNPDDPEGHRVPDSRDLVAQYLLLYSLSGEPGDFDDVVDYDYRIANLRAQLASDASPLAQAEIDRLDAYAAEHLAPLGIETTVSGTSRTTATFVALIVTGQVRSLFLGVVLVACLTAFMCRSLVGGLLTALPVAAAIVFNLGLLGITGVPLGVTMALMSSMALGIGVDYAIHFIIKYRSVRMRSAGPREALVETLASTGVAIFYNAVVVVAGFLVLAMSNFPPNQTLGLLVSFNMMVCFVGTVTLLAAVLHVFQPAFVLPPGTRRDSRGA